MLTLSAPRPLKARRDWVDYARAISVILIAFAHISGGLIRNGVDLPSWVNTIPQSTYYSRVPLFFIITGFFIRQSLTKRDLGGFVAYKLSSVTYNYFLWGGLQLVFQIVASRFGGTGKTYHWSELWYIFYKPHHFDQFWFLFALGNSCWLFALVHWATKGSRTWLLAVGLALYGASLVMTSEVYDLFAVRATCTMFIFLVIGDLTSRIMLDRSHLPLLSSWRVLVLSSLVFGFFLAEVRACCVPDPGRAQPILQPFANDWWIALLATFFGLGFFVNLSFVLEKHNLFPWLRSFGKYSLQVYALHLICAGVARAVMLKLLHIHDPWLVLAVTVLAGIALPALLGKLAQLLGVGFLFRFPPIKFKRPPRDRPGHNEQPPFLPFKQTAV
jgi:fucose 4-O-acetylase-like acetyltransferase